MSEIVNKAVTMLNEKISAGAFAHEILLVYPPAHARVTRPRM